MLKYLWNKILDYWEGKLHTETYNIGKSIAYIELFDEFNEENNSITITREGYIDDFGSLGIFVVTSSELLNKYFTKKSRTFIQDDKGIIIPVHAIKNIRIVHEDKFETVSWRS